MASGNLKLKYHDKPVNDFTEINKYLMIPKKLHQNFPEGEIEMSIAGKKILTRVYDIYCECVAPKHIHKIIDLREFDGAKEFKENQEIEIS